MVESITGTPHGDIKSTLGCLALAVVPTVVCLGVFYFISPSAPQEPTRTPIPSSPVWTPLPAPAPSSTPPSQPDMNCVTIGPGDTAYDANRRLGNPLTDGRLYYDPMGASPMTRIDKLPNPVYAGDLLCEGLAISNPASMTHKQRKQAKVLGRPTGRPQKFM